MTVTTDVREETPPLFAERVLGRALLIGALCGGVLGFALMLPEVVASAQGRYVEDLDPGLWGAISFFGAFVGAGSALLGSCVWMAANHRISGRVRRAISALSVGLPVFVLGHGWDEPELAAVAGAAVLLALVAEPWVTVVPKRG